VTFIKFTGKRLLHAVLVLAAVLVLNFILIHLAPGDVVEVIVGSMGGASEELVAQMRSEYGLDRSLPEQLWVYLSRMIRGDLGYSYYFNMPVIDLILPRVLPTVLLVMSSLAVAVALGTFLGVQSARKPESLSSNVVTVVSLFGYSAPVFWTGIMLLLLFGAIIPIFPISGMYDIVKSTGGIGRVLDILHHLILPMFTLAILHVALYGRLSRASMLDVLGSDYIRTARAKGLSERTVVYKHALRNAVLPVVTMTGLQMGRLFAGAVVVETVFAWPGLGTLAYQSILRRDTNTLLGLLFFSTLMIVAANLLTDFTYGLIDPRIGSERNRRD